MQGMSERELRTKPCPLCGKRCADVDLNRWLSNVYAVPANDADTDEDERPSAKRADEGS